MGRAQGNRHATSSTAAFSAVFGTRRGSERPDPPEDDWSAYGPNTPEIAHFMHELVGVRIELQAGRGFSAQGLSVPWPPMAEIEYALELIDKQPERAQQLERMLDDLSDQLGVGGWSSSLTQPFEAARAENELAAATRYAAMACCCHDLIARDIAAQLEMPWVTIFGGEPQFG